MRSARSVISCRRFRVAASVALCLFVSGGPAETLAQEARPAAVETVRLFSTSVNDPELWKRRVTVKLALETGGAIEGRVVDATDHGVVILFDSIPQVFAWIDVEPASALIAKRQIVSAIRGSLDDLTSDDCLMLAEYALARGRRELATPYFARARDVNPDVASLIRDLQQRYSRVRTAREDAKKERDDEEAIASSPAGEAEIATDVVDKAMPSPLDGDEVVRPSPEARARVMDVYRTWGESTREQVTARSTLVETDHFLIWTDWDPQWRPRIGEWLEAMYADLARYFSVPAGEHVFLAKCPVFCWKSKQRFKKFSRVYDGFEMDNATGYTRSIEASGHTHIVAYRTGLDPEDLDRFAATLIHESTHAFLHRMYGHRLLPHWVNEGHAELVTERLLGNRTPAGENAELLARQYGRFDWSIADMLAGVDPIPLHQYPLAHSVVAYLDSRGEKRLREFVRLLKQGQDVETALSGAFDGMTPAMLEEQWKRHVRGEVEAVQSSESPTPDAGALLPHE